MEVNTLEIYRRYTGEETFKRIKHYDTLSQMWEERSKEYVELTAVMDNGSSYTYAQLADDVAKFRTVLKNSGARKGDTVALYIPNSYDFVKAFLAVVTSGCTAAVLPAQIDEKAVCGCCMMFRASALVAAESLSANTAAAKQAIASLSVVSAEETAEEASSAVDCEGKDGCAIVMTGGTTGRPKGALLSNTAVMHGVINSCYGVPESFEQRYMLVLPLSHVFGLIRNMLASLFTGSTLFICRNNKDMFRDAAMFRPTIMVLVPALAEMALTLSKKFGKNMFGDSLKTIICGAANVPPYLITEYDKMGVSLLPGYGLTESANLVSGNPEPLKKPDSVGIMFPEQEYTTAMCTRTAGSRPATLSGSTTRASSTSPAGSKRSSCLQTARTSLPPRSRRSSTRSTTSRILRCSRTPTKAANTSSLLRWFPAQPRSQSSAKSTSTPSSSRSSRRSTQSFPRSSA